MNGTLSFNLNQHSRPNLGYANHTARRVTETTEVARLQNFRLYAALSIVSLYMLLEAAFMLVRIPPGSVAAVPTGELIIAFFMLTIIADRGLFSQFARSVPIIPVVIWWAIGFTQLTIGFLEHGFWAMRDGTNLVESLFLWVGFASAAVAGAVPKIAKWFYRALILSACIALTYPFRDFVRDISPQIMSAVQVPTPLFFTYQLTPIMSLACATYLFITGKRILSIPADWIAAGLIIFVAALFQARTIYLQIFVIGAYLSLINGTKILRALVPLSAAVLVFLALIALGVPIPGRISQNVSLSFYFDHFLAILGGSSEKTGLEEEAIRGAAGGVSQRLNWWSAIWAHVTASWHTTLFGLGYGESLVALANDPYIDPAVREPHNSIISSFGRTGFVGVAAYIAMHISLAFTALRAFLHYRASGHEEAAKFIYMLGALFLLFWIAAIGEDAFEKPFVAIPYYFYYGVILNMFARAAYAKPAAATQRHRPAIMSVTPLR